MRSDDTTLLLSLHHTRDSLARLRANPAVALTVLTEGDVAFSARGRAHVIRDALESTPRTPAWRSRSSTSTITVSRASR